VFVLHGYVKVETVPAVFSSDNFLFNIGFPCLIDAYSRAIYPCLKYLKDRIRRVFEIVLVQCYVFVVAEIVETTVLDDQHISLHVHFILSASFCLYGLFVLIVNGRNLFLDC
jgi:Trk-type K+ transport system membrane component